jgi:hypothetical protein
MSLLWTVRVGAKYLHYSGKGPYTITGIALNASTLKPDVIYRQDYQHEKFRKGQLWHRDLDEFLGKVNRNGQWIPRFKRIQ